MRRLWWSLVLLGIGFLFFGSIVTSQAGFALYIKKEPSLDYIVSEIGTVRNIERLILTFNQRYALMLIGYNERQGLRIFKTMPALP